jgi:hypothetical protein
MAADGTESNEMTNEHLRGLLKQTPDGDLAVLAALRDELRARELQMLHAMVRCYQANTGKLPTTVKEIADHWYELSDTALDPEQFGDDRIPECIWLRKLEKRPDADALLAQALAFPAPSQPH